MPALETFDWFKEELWPSAPAELRGYLEEKRKHLLKIRNENERRRFIEEVMQDVRARMHAKP